MRILSLFMLWLPLTLVAQTFGDLPPLEELDEEEEMEAMESTNAAKKYELFGQEELFECTIKADFASFLADRTGKAKAQMAVISYQMPNGMEMDLPLKIKVRGHYRRDPLVCYFPPIKLDFDKDLTKPAPFQGQNKIKLVTHCDEEQYIFREYYLYQVCRMLTDKSFRVRLAKVTYQDINSARPTETRYAFMIESEEELAQRLGGEPLDDDVPIQPEDVDQEQLALVHLFNYMIANKDFDIQVRQNVKIVDQRKGKPLVIPYDFDWSGMVNAPYTKLSDNEGPVYEERQRFKSLCLSEAEYQSLVDRFLGIEDQVIALYEHAPHFTEEQKTEIIDYFKTFFKQIKNPKTISKVFRKSCQ
jgi:hypothetical protein